MTYNAVKAAEISLGKALAQRIAEFMDLYPDVRVEQAGRHVRRGRGARTGARGGCCHMRRRLIPPGIVRGGGPRRRDRTGSPAPARTRRGGGGTGRGPPSR